MVRTAKLACVLLMIPLGCAVGEFACTADSQCGADGECEAEGWCSFPDGTCPAGRRFGAHSGGGLGGVCVPDHGETGGSSAAPDPSSSTTTDASSGEASSLPPIVTSDPMTTSESSASVTLTSEAGSSSSGEMLDPSLLLWLAFDDEAAPWADVGEHGHDATCAAGQCPVLDSGPLAGAARFDGIDDQLHVDAGDALATPSAFSIALWITVDTLPTEIYQDVFTRAYGATYANSWGVGFPPDTTLMRFVVHDGAAQLLVGQFEWPARGGWHHVAGTWDGMTARLYSDGAVVSELAVAAVAFDEHPVLVGADLENDVVVNFFGGAVDDVRIYARALSEDEIASLAAN